MGNFPGRANGRQENQAPFLRRAGLYLGVAFELPGTILGGLVIGYFLDQYLGSSPWLLLACTALAFVGAFIRLIQWVKLLGRKGDGSGGKKDNPAD